MCTAPYILDDQYFSNAILVVVYPYKLANSLINTNIRKEVPGNSNIRKHLRHLPALIHTTDYYDSAK
jgi:hypothetical protein